MSAAEQIKTDVASPASRLRNARIGAGYSSATAAAAALGMVLPTYCHHENGTRAYGTKEAVRYAMKFGVTPAHLLLGEDVPDGAEQIKPSAPEGVRRGAVVEACEDAKTVAHLIGAATLLARRFLLEEIDDGAVVVGDEHAEIITTLLEVAWGRADASYERLVEALEPAR